MIAEAARFIERLATKAGSEIVEEW